MAPCRRPHPLTSTDDPPVATGRLYKVKSKGEEEEEEEEEEEDFRSGEIRFTQSARKPRSQQVGPNSTCGGLSALFFSRPKIYFIFLFFFCLFVWFFFFLLFCFVCFSLSEGHVGAGFKEHFHAPLLHAAATREYISPLSPPDLNLVLFSNVRHLPE